MVQDTKIQEAVTAVDEIAQGLADSGGVRAFFNKVGNSTLAAFSMLGVCLIVCVLINTGSLEARTTAEARKITAHAISIEIQNEKITIGNFGAGAVRVNNTNDGVVIKFSPVNNAVEYRVRYGIGGFQDILTVSADMLLEDEEGNVTIQVAKSNFGSGWDSASTVNPVFVMLYAYDSSDRSTSSMNYLITSTP